MHKTKFEFGYTSLHFAAATDRSDIVKTLLENNASIEARGVKGDMPLLAAAKWAMNNQCYDHGSLDPFEVVNLNNPLQEGFDLHRF